MVLLNVDVVQEHTWKAGLLRSLLLEVVLVAHPVLF